jgi:2-methylisocitrate lyase-like PEP mutase family enzyme
LYADWFGMYVLAVESIGKLRRQPRVTANIEQLRGGLLIAVGSTVRHEPLTQEWRESAMSHQAEKANLLRSLHNPGVPLVLPNAWDVGTARAVVDAGFPVVATTSNAIAAALGYEDGEGAPSEQMMFVAQRIAASVDVPVTVDAEAGYGMTALELVERLAAIGVVGCNIEDTDHANGGLIDAEARAAYIAEMRAAADRIGVPVVINARIDSFFPTSLVPAGRKRADAIGRAKAYWSAGADCVFPIGAGTEDLKAIIDEVGAPVNGGLRLDTGSLDELREIGVARVSVGPQFYRITLEHLHAKLALLKQRDSDEVSTEPLDRRRNS